MMYYAGAKVNPAAIVRASHALGGQVQLCQGYGLTETSGSITALTPLDHRDAAAPGAPAQAVARLESCGRANPETLIEIAAPDGGGGEVPRGETGEVVVRTAQLALGYLECDPGGDPDRATLRPLPCDARGRFRTGDLGRIDADGYLYIIGRLKEVISTRFGPNAYPSAIEAVALEVDGVAECAAVGVPLDAGERVALAIVVAPGRDRAEVAAACMAHCSANLPRHERPETIRAFDALPRSLHYGKIVRREVLALIQRSPQARL
jgi:acyl-CoA synthetase (AMP-forming)/AMP-acid ligase II